MSRLAFSPKSKGPKSKYPAFSWDTVVGSPWSSVWNKKNSHFGLTCSWYPIAFAFSTVFFRICRGSFSKGVPSWRYTSQMSLATFPCCGLHGKISNVFKSGYRYISESSSFANPSIEEPSNTHRLSSAFSSWFVVIAIFFIIPYISVNWSRIKPTSSSSTSLYMSLFV